jgi:transposase
MFTVFKKIEKSTACEMRSVIHFLNARNTKLADIQRQLCEVYEKHATSESMVRRWVRHFNEGRKSVYDDPWRGQPSVVYEDLVAAVEEKIQENRAAKTNCLEYTHHIALNKWTTPLIRWIGLYERL